MTPFPARPTRRATLAIPLALGACLVAACSPWPTTSRAPVEPLAQPTLAARVAGLHPGPDEGFSFVAFGDQRALAGGEWEAMLASIDSLARSEPRLLLMLDTGDMVQNGSHSDQFGMLAGILRKAETLPYLVAVGNHELADNRPGPARAHTAAFLAPIDSVLSTGRLYYEVTIGRARILFLDTNDLVYDQPGVAARREAQLAWLDTALRRAPVGPGHPTVVVMHHPFLQSSQKHRPQARALWSLTHGGRTLPALFADHGVDLVISGHTHTYERFRVGRPDGRGFQLVNLSGRPKGSFLGLGAGLRRARRLEPGGGAAFFARHGWRDLEGWTIVQEEAMTADEANQFARFDVDADGSIAMAVRFMNRGAAGPRVPLVAAPPRLRPTAPAPGT